MKIVLLWRGVGDRAEMPDPTQVTSNLQALYAPLFHTLPNQRVLQNDTMSMVVLELPVHGWKPPFFEEDDHSWALAIDYPLDAPTALASKGQACPDDRVLLSLCRELQADPRDLLREMAPPFALIWSSKDSSETFVQNDGLGHAPLFEYRDERLWVLTNKITALSALGVQLEPDREQWAVRATLGYFLQDMTGFKRLRYVEAGTQLWLKPDGISRTICDVLTEWFHPDPLSKDDCLELARWSLLSRIEAAMPRWERPYVGLSGGWDTRALVSTLRVAGAEFCARVNGLPGRHDVVIATELARIAGFPLHVGHAAGLPPDDAAGCRRNIALALLWHAGYMDTQQHKEFVSLALQWQPGYDDPARQRELMARERPLDAGTVYLMGQYGEIGRSYYEKRLRAWELPEDQYEDRLVSRFTRKMFPFLRADLREVVSAAMRKAYRQADRYGVIGIGRLPFYFLTQRLRRWGSGSNSSQIGLVAAPFLNPDFIRAVAAYPDSQRDVYLFHRYIIAKNSPDWAHLPYEADLHRKETDQHSPDAAWKSDQQRPAPQIWKQPRGNENYDAPPYWRLVGKPIIDEAFALGGFWTEVFDPDASRERWEIAADTLAIVHLLPAVLRGTFDHERASRR
jgi:hypothetical protein